MDSLMHMDSTIKSRCSTVLTLCLFCLISLSATAAAPPSNDTCAGRVTIPGNGPFPYKTTTIDISGATITGDPPAGPCPSSAASSVWYEFRPQGTALYTNSTCAEAGTATTLADTVMAIYTASGTCSGYAQVACEDDVCGPDGLQAAITTTLTGNITYYVVVWRYDDGGPVPPSQDAQLQLIVSPSQVPQNDVCSTATELPLNFRMSGSTLATFNDYQLSGSRAQGRDVAYGFTAPENGTYSFAVHGYRGDDLIVYATTNCPTGIPPITW